MSLADLAAALEADRKTIERYAGEDDNGQKLRMLLDERRGRFDQDARCEIGQRHAAYLIQQTRREHPGMTRRERLFPFAPPPEARHGDREAQRDAWVKSGIREPLAGFLAGLADSVGFVGYRDAILPIVRQIRGAIERGDVRRSVELEKSFEVVLNPFWQRKFRQDREDALGVKSSEMPELALVQAEEL
ncbi:MAG: hypothetical protein RL885_24920 [Planctomycetota bacterium]